MMAGERSVIRRVLDDPYVLWGLLALPAVWLIVGKFGFDARIAYLYWTGVLSCWLLVVTMMVTPLQMLFGPLPWLRRRRRYLGVASFGYAALHLGVWLIGVTRGELIRSFFRTEILTGWIAMAVFVALAATSFDRAVRMLGPRWKTLQRWVYPAAVLTLIHWVMTADSMTNAALSSLPLAVLSIWRVMRNRGRIRSA